MFFCISVLIAFHCPGRDIKSLITFASCGYGSAANSGRRQTHVPASVLKGFKRNPLMQSRLQNSQIRMFFHALFSLQMVTITFLTYLLLSDFGVSSGP